MNAGRKKVWVVAMALMMLLTAGCGGEVGGMVEKTPNHPQVEKYEPVEVSLVAVGDLLMHNTVINAGQLDNGKYNYDYMFEPINGILASADYSWLTMECAMAGPGSEYTGYPLFNAPDQLADSFKNNGFDLIVTSNNHCLDRGEKGALRTLEVLHQRGLDTIGTYASQEEASKYLIKDIKGIKVGFLSYTYDTNGIPIPDNVYVSMVDHDKILSDIQTLKPQVDFLVLILHWGEEYATMPSGEQQEWAREFLQTGADTIIGSHVHVIQPDQEMMIEGQKKYVIYSLGNSLGNQVGIDRNSGVMVRVNIKRETKDGPVRLDSIDTIPSFSQAFSDDGKRKYHVIPLEKVINAAKNGDYSLNEGNESIDELISINRSIRQRLDELN